MLRREQFPVELFDYLGKSYSNPLMIPPFHPRIVEEGIDLDMALSVIDESIENTKLDFAESSIRDVTESSSYEYDKFASSYFEGKQRGIYSPKFPFTKELFIAPDRISPVGSDNYVRVDEKSPLDSYYIPIEESFSSELMEEYKMSEIRKNKNYSIVEYRKGWKSHNVDFREVFYKNLIIALDNAVVKKKYNL